MRAETSSARPAGAAAAGAVALLFGVCVGGVEFYTKGEPREAIVVRAILEGEGVVAPLRNGGEIPSKPPMFHWLGAALSTAAGGLSETPARLPSVVAAAGTVGLTAALGTRLFGAAAGLASAGVLATFTIFSIAAATARVDMTFAFFTTLALVAFFQSTTREPRSVPWLCYAAAAGAVLTKGPAGVVLPAAVAVAYLVARGELREVAGLVRRRAALWLLLPVAWYGAGIVAHGAPFFEKLVVEENVLRVLDAGSAKVGHVKPFYAYVGLLIAGTAPWSLFFPSLIAFAWRRARRPRSDATLFLLLWLVVPFLLFSLADSKRAVYLLPSYPALALLVGHWWSQVASEPEAAWQSAPVLMRWSARLLAGLFVFPVTLMAIEALGIPVLSGLAALLGLTAGDRANLSALSGFIGRHAASTALWALATAALAFGFERSITRGRCWPALATVVVLLGMGYLFLSQVLQKELAATQSLRGLAERVQASSPREAPVYFYQGRDYGAVYYMKRAVQSVASAGEIAPSDRAVVLVRRADAGRLRADFEFSWPGLELHEIARHTYGDNPRRDPLLALMVIDPT